MWETKWTGRWTPKPHRARLPVDRTSRTGRRPEGRLRSFGMRFQGRSRNPARRSGTGESGLSIPEPSCRRRRPGRCASSSRREPVRSSRRVFPCPGIPKPQVGLVHQCRGLKGVICPKSLGGQRSQLVVHEFQQSVGRSRISRQRGEQSRCCLRSGERGHRPQSSAKGNGPPRHGKRTARPSYIGLSSIIALPSRATDASENPPNERRG